MNVTEDCILELETEASEELTDLHLLPRAVVERSDRRRQMVHTLDATWSRADTLFIQRRSAHHYRLSGFTSCLGGSERLVAA